MKNFDQLETAQLESMHQQAHEFAEAGEDCLANRHQHDSIAAELIKRGVVHDTAIVCPEPDTDAPNYQRGFTDDICIHCAFGQLFPHCNLYNFEYQKDFVCDSFRYYDVIELEPPHGFLMTNGKQTALASPDKIDINKAALIVSNGEAFGIAEFSQPAQINTKQFDSDDWQSEHRVTPRERRQWWPDANSFYVYRIKRWTPYKGTKLYQDDCVIDEPKLSAKQWRLVSKSKELPKQIILDDAAVAVTDKQEFIIGKNVHSEALLDILTATYDTEIKAAKNAKETIPIYALALVRNPRMRVSKKNLIAEAMAEPEEPEATKQEDDKMPFGIRQNDDGEYCVINTDTEEVMGCHKEEPEAEAQLVALRINVEAEEEDASRDKPKKKPEPKKEASLDSVGDADTITDDSETATPESIPKSTS